MFDVSNYYSKIDPGIETGSKVANCVQILQFIHILVK